ncbi:MAG: phenylalanine--tRNA ligase subunit alpha [Cytophagales bacterium]
MLDRINALSLEIEQQLIQDKNQLEEFRLKYLSKNGIINSLFEEFKLVPPDVKKTIGAPLNVLKKKAESKFNEAQESLEGENKKEDFKFDFTRTAFTKNLGSRHPLSIVRSQIVDIFIKIGFTVADGPEIEDDWHNFSALNFPENHPAREMQDTFFLSKEPEFLLRTHTSTVQVRVMENQKPPIRSIMPGRVYRNEAISARAHCLFHQIEGLYINENVSFADLKNTLYYFVKQLFGKDTQIRFRPSYFPFTEPSAEMDISCLICKGEGCNICKHSGWVEIGGAGMVDPHVLEANKIDSKKYSGFAFGVGIERITMLKYGVKDLRDFTENDVRFLKQFVPISN